MDMASKRATTCYRAGLSALLNLLLGRPEPPFRMGLCFTRDVFFSLGCQISEVSRPIAAKLCHMIRIWLQSQDNLVQKFGGRSLKKYWGPKTCKISVDFIQPQTLIANISGTAQDIQNRKENEPITIRPAFYEKGPVNFGPLI